MIRVIKIGGNVVDNPEALKRFVKDFATLDGAKILVHGGGKEATKLLEPSECRHVWSMAAALLIKILSIL